MKSKDDADHRPRDGADVERLRYERWHDVMRLSNELHRLALAWWHDDPALRKRHYDSCGLCPPPPVNPKSPTP